MNRYLITYEEGHSIMVIEAPSKELASDIFHIQFGEGDEHRDTNIVRIEELTTVFEYKDQTFTMGKTVSNPENYTMAEWEKPKYLLLKIKLDPVKGAWDNIDDFIHEFNKHSYVQSTTIVEPVEDK